MTPDPLSKLDISEFRPAWWLPNGHSQTLWRKVAGTSSVSHRRQRVELSDRDFIDLDWCEEVDVENSEDIVLVVHGLCGCSESSYVQALQSLLATHAVASVAMNLRGCSGEVNRKARTYHSGVSDDLGEIIAILHDQHKTKNLIVVAYSLGANVLLKWLGEAGNQSMVEKAIAVSTPFILQLCSQSLQSGFSRLYGRYFTRRLVSDLQNKIKHFERVRDEEQLQTLLALGNSDRISNVWEFDERVTAPLHGFSGAEDYYGQCSSIGFLSSIETRTLLIQSSDDPMIPPAALPTAAQLSPAIEYELLDKGGHVGFVNAQTNPWLEHRILRFVQSD